MTQADINAEKIVLQDTLVRLAEIISDKLYMGLPIDDMLDTQCNGISLVYAASGSSLVYTEAMRDTLYELMDRVVMRCQKYA